jgi:signal recognition particle GTPase
VLLIVGVNGGGKTTTIGKLAHKFASEGAKVMLGSGDTFRAAAFEQLRTWAERTGALMGSYTEGSRPAKVLTRAVREAAAHGCDVIICDTSGRLHTNWQLMEELAKVERDIRKVDAAAPHEVLLVLDGSTGLNMLNQARPAHVVHAARRDCTRCNWIWRCTTAAVTALCVASIGLRRCQLLLILASDAQIVASACQWHCHSS